jgi:hypothetical protein
MPRKNPAAVADDADISTQFQESQSPNTHAPPAKPPQIYPLLTAPAVSKNSPATCSSQQTLPPPQKEPTPGNFMVAIRGERHSGTSWIRHLISTNAPDTEYIQAFYGHKHSDFHSEHAARLASNPHHVIGFVWRNVFQWLLKMHKDTYCEIYDGHGTDHHRMRPDYKDDGSPRGPPQIVSANMLKVEQNFSYFLRQAHILPVWQACDQSGRSPSFMHTRNLRYRNWLAQMKHIGPNQTSHVQYEVLAADPESRLWSILDNQGVPRNKHFQQSQHHVKYGAVVGHDPSKKASSLPTNTSNNNSSFAPLKPADYMPKYALADLQYVLERLDPAVEWFTGYGSYEPERRWAEVMFGVNVTNAAWKTFGSKCSVEDEDPWGGQL